MKIYNTLIRRKEEFVPREEGKVGIYVCGPTVYGYVHIGNARPYVFFSVFVRYLRSIGYQVDLVENVTDVDDKIIERANRECVPAAQVAETYTRAYFKDTSALGLGRPGTEPLATGHIPEIVDLCRRLVDAGMAYETGGSVYFRVEKFAGYGKLSGQKTDQMRHCELAREGEAKESPLDFAVWRGLFAPLPMRIATLLFVVALALHAWVGMRDIFMDYVHPLGLRLALHIAALLWLVACVVWAGAILWSLP